MSANVSGLQRGTTYYYRAVASNADGAGVGAQQTFVTRQFPELGRCLKTATAHSRYKTSACTTLSAGARTAASTNGSRGRSPTRTSRSRSKRSAFEAGPGKDTKATVLLECASGSAQGEYTGPQTATMSLVLSGCGLRFFGTAVCSSAGAAAGEVRVPDLPAQLGFIEDGSKPSVGWALNSPTSGQLDAACEKVP